MQTWDCKSNVYPGKSEKASFCLFLLLLLFASEIIIENYILETVLRCILKKPPV